MAAASAPSGGSTSTCSASWPSTQATPTPRGLPARHRPAHPQHRRPAPTTSRSLPISTVADRSEEHTSELQSLMRISYAVFCLQKKKQHERHISNIPHYSHDYT